MAELTRKIESLEKLNQTTLYDRKNQELERCYDRTALDRAEAFVSRQLMREVERLTESHVRKIMPNFPLDEVKQFVASMDWTPLDDEAERLADELTAYEKAVYTMPLKIPASFCPLLPRRNEDEIEGLRIRYILETDSTARELWLAWVDALARIAEAHTKSSPNKRTHGKFTKSN